MKYKKHFYILGILLIVLIIISTIVITLVVNDKESEQAESSNTNISYSTEYITEYATDITKESPSENATTKENESYSLPVKVILQYPDMPSGCEITSLTMVLNYMGLDVTNSYLADNYLPCDTHDMNRSFVGSVYDDYAFGCFAPVIVQAANNYLNSINSKLRAVEISGSTREQLLSYVKAGNPVIIWNTENMEESHLEHLNLDGDDFVWYYNEHCVVLCGYNEADNTVAVADSISGYVYRNADIFFERYNFMKKQAIYIQK